jgi:hypothetical protein
MPEPVDFAPYIRNAVEALTRGDAHGAIKQLHLEYSMIDTDLLDDEERTRGILEFAIAAMGHVPDTPLTLRAKMAFISELSRIAPDSDPGLSDMLTSHSLDLTEAVAKAGQSKLAKAYAWQIANSTRHQPSTHKRAVDMWRSLRTDGGPDNEDDPFGAFKL